MHRLVVCSGGPPLQGQPIAAHAAAAGGMSGSERSGQTGWYHGSDALSSLKGRERLRCSHWKPGSWLDLELLMATKVTAIQDAEVTWSKS